MLNQEEDKKVYLNCGDLILDIWDMEDNPPPDKRTKKYEQWRKEINELYKMYNKFANFKAFKLIQ
jgi:hypothetical protein